jgi:hypothetical protein
MHVDCKVDGIWEVGVGGEDVSTGCKLPVLSVRGHRSIKEIEISGLSSLLQP